ncbi:MAG: GNAT family N-acetyltransferase [Robiginitomaculum sp.]|nr:MAG: GNAT family N-acetyltransferase [Robiginitomaculum sp.]
MDERRPTLDLGPTIETERLILRPPILADFAERAEMARDEETMALLGGGIVPALAWRSFAAQVGHWALRGYGFFDVLEKTSGAVVGSVGTHFPQDWPGREVGWVIHRACWRKGYGFEAAMAAMAYAFDDLGWDQVIHVISPENIPSQKLAAALGSRHLRTIEKLAGYGEITNQIWGQSRAEWVCEK